MGDARWFCRLPWDDDREPWYVPRPIYDLLEKRDFTFDEYNDAETPEDAAMLALSRACVSYGRQLAGLMAVGAVVTS